MDKINIPLNKNSLKYEQRRELTIMRTEEIIQNEIWKNAITIKEQNKN